MSNGNRPPDFDVTPEADNVLPLYPILDKDEVWDGVTDFRDQLPIKDRAELPEEVVVIHIRENEIKLPKTPVDAIEVVKKAARARNHLDIGYMGPTVASVNLHETEELSRYERPHGRDDIYAADDVKAWYAKPLDTAAQHLFQRMGVSNEIFIPGQPYGFEKPGSIILVDFDPADPLGLKFQQKNYGNRDSSLPLMLPGFY